MKDKCPFKVEGYKHLVDCLIHPKDGQQGIWSDVRDKCKLIKERRHEYSWDKCVGEDICPVFKKGDLSFIIQMERGR